MRLPFADENNILIFQIEINRDEVWIKEMPAPVALQTDANQARVEAKTTQSTKKDTENAEQAKIFQMIYSLVQSRWNLTNEYGKLFFPMGNVESKEKHDEEFIFKCLEEIYKGIESSNFSLSYLLGQ